MPSSSTLAALAAALLPVAAAVWPEQQARMQPEPAAPQVISTPPLHMFHIRASTEVHTDLARRRAG